MTLSTKVVVVLAKSMRKLDGRGNMHFKSLNGVVAVKWKDNKIVVME